MRIAIGCDHIVTDVKDKIKAYLMSEGHDVVDSGTYDFTRTHYPIYGKRVAEEVVNNDYDFGVIICGTGVGISNSAQKVKGARVSLVRDLQTAITAREQFDANIIAFGGRVTGTGVMEEAIDKFISTKFVGDPKLVEKIDGIIDEKANKNVHFKKELDKWEKGEYHD